MLLTLLKALEITDLKTFLGYLSLSPLDIDLLLYEAKDKGEVKIDMKKGKIVAQMEPSALYYNPELADKMIKVIGQYDALGGNITRSRLEQITLDLAGGHGYPIHEFICTMYALEQQQVAGQPKLNKYQINVPQTKKRPDNVFEFYTLLDHQEFGNKAVNDFIGQWDKLKLK